eukprot:3910734-Karenia_brevis.AAC.1
MSPRKISRVQSVFFLLICATVSFQRRCTQPMHARSVDSTRKRGLLRNKGRSRGGSAPPQIEVVLAGSGAYFLRP